MRDDVITVTEPAFPTPSVDSSDITPKNVDTLPMINPNTADFKAPPSISLCDMRFHMFSRNVPSFNPFIYTR